MTSVSLNKESRYKIDPVKLAMGVLICMVGLSVNAHNVLANIVAVLLGAAFIFSSILVEEK